MITYSIGGRAAAPSAGGDPHAALWNNSTTKTIYVVRILVEGIGASSAAAAVAFQRTSTRGTPGSTLTPTADNCNDDVVAPASGALLDLADFTVVPTFEGPRFSRFTLLNDGAGWEFRFDKYAVPQQTGLALEVVSTLTAEAVSFEWME